jgi:hypothetical protein
MKGTDHFSFFPKGELGIAEKAHELRAKLNIAEKIYVDIIDILEFRITDIVPDFRLMVRRDIELDGLAFTTTDPPRIFVRESVYDAACNGDPRSREILAHELGHLLLHKDVTLGRMQENAEGYIEQFRKQNLSESSEKQADVFARNFLIPAYIAFAHRDDAQLLSSSTGTTTWLAAAAITVAKRTEMYALRKRDVFPRMQ